ncbi:MAG: hypothetical protein HBSAPP03_08780 [Phycisphaerae bacterium]|nr:MAG: hypothetical protein HBSAPP03_08780 [Phycisphaerae bacterium]
MLAGLAASMSAYAGVASFGVAPNGEPPLPIPGGGGGGGYDDRDDGMPFDGVVAGDSATMSLKMYDMNGGVVSINAGGDLSVGRGPSFKNLGLNRNGPSSVQGSWDSVISGNRMYIIAMFRLTSITDQFMPPGANNNGVPAFAWTWNFGTLDPITWAPYVTSVQIAQAQAYFSNDLGVSYTNGSVDFTGNLPSGQWVPGSDHGLLLPTFGDGTNAVLLSYELNIVPAPSSLGVLAGVGLLACRRRR